MSTTNWRQLNGSRAAPRSPRWLERRAEQLSRGGPTLAHVLDVPYLLATFEQCRTKGQAPGPDGWRYADFGRQELTRAFGALCTEVRAGRYRPPASRIVETPKRDGSTRPLALDNVLHRVLAAAVLGVVGPALERHLSPITHSACGRGVHTLLRSLHRAYATGRFPFIVNHDVRRAFPSLPVEVAVCAFGAHITDRPLLDLIELLLRGADGPAHRIGIPQGLALSPLALDLVMSHHVDRHWPTECDSPVALRYVDNLVHLCATANEGRHTVDRCRTLLGRVGLSLRDDPESAYLCDLRNGETELLGFRLTGRTSELEFDIGPGALEALCSSLTEARDTPCPPRTAQTAVVGWLGAMGPAFATARVDHLTELILSATRRHGYREIPGSLVRATWERAGREWRHSLRPPGDSVPHWGV